MKSLGIRNNVFTAIILLLFVSGCVSNDKSLDLNKRTISSNLMLQALDSMNIFYEKNNEKLVFNQVALTKRTLKMLINLHKNYLTSCDSKERMVLSEILANVNNEFTFKIQENEFLKIEALKSDSMKKLEFSHLAYDESLNKIMFYLGVKCITNDCNFSSGGVFVCVKENDAWILKSYTPLWYEAYDENALTGDLLPDLNICD